MKTSLTPKPPNGPSPPALAQPPPCVPWFLTSTHPSAPSNVASTPIPPHTVTLPPWCPGPDSPKVIVVPNRVAQGTFLSSRLISQIS